MVFSSTFSRMLATDRPAEQVFRALALRADQGLYDGVSPAKNRFQVVHRSMDRIELRAKGLLTTVSIGPDRIFVEVQPEGGLILKISYRRWVAWRHLLCLGLAASAAVGLALFAQGPLHALSLALHLDWHVLAGAGAGALGLWALGWPRLLLLLHRAAHAGELLDILEQCGAGSGQ